MINSFINLMSNTVYTEHQLSKRIQAIERNRFSKRDEQILNRVLIGIALGTHIASPEELAEISAFNDFLQEITTLKALVKQENYLLVNAVRYELATKRLERPTKKSDINIPEFVEIEDETVLNPIIKKDKKERDESWAIINSANQEVLDLLALRIADRGSHV